jgi:hypothetical protein
MVGVRHASGQAQKCQQQSLSRALGACNMGNVPQ